MGTQPDEVTNGGNGEADPHLDQIAAEIDETRGDLTDTVREIGTRLEPANIAREAKETVRGATIGKVEMMSIGAQETWRDVRTGNAGGIVDMVRENPVPAGMIGLGLAMLFLNRGSQGGADVRRTGWQPRGDYGRYAIRRSPDWHGSGNGGSNPMDRVGSMAADARDSISDTADRVSDSVSQMADDLPQQAGAMVDSGTSQARRMIEENPLGAGMIALAAGAALGMLLPSTPFERETVGPMRDQVVEQVGVAAEGAIDAAKSAAHSSGGAGASQI